MSFRIMIITSFLIFSLLLYLPEANGNQDAKRLYEDLFTHYNLLVRPVENSSDFLTVKLSLKLAKIVELVCFPEDSSLFEFSKFNFGRATGCSWPLKAGLRTLQSGGPDEFFWPLFYPNCYQLF